MKPLVRAVLLGALAATAAGASVPGAAPPSSLTWERIRHAWPGEDPHSWELRRRELVHALALAHLQEALAGGSGETLEAARHGGEARLLEQKLDELGPARCALPLGPARDVVLERIRVEFLDRAPDRRLQMRRLVQVAEAEVARLKADPTGSAGWRLASFQVLLSRIRRLAREIEPAAGTPPCHARKSP